MGFSSLVSLLSSLSNIILPIIAIIVGATVQYYVSKASEDRKVQQNLRTQAYVDFLRGSAGLAIAQREGDKTREKDYAILLTEARVRITVYANKEVIAAVANFFRAGGKLNTKEQMRLYLAICGEMRKQGMPKDSPADKDFAQLLFSSDLANEKCL